MKCLRVGGERAIGAPIKVAGPLLVGGERLAGVRAAALDVTRGGSVAIEIEQIVGRGKKHRKGRDSGEGIRIVGVHEGLAGKGKNIILDGARLVRAGAWTGEN